MSEFSGIQADNNVDRNQYVPTNVGPMLAQDSEAYRCFTKQQFSRNLQIFMVNYVMVVESFYPVFK